MQTDDSWRVFDAQTPVLTYSYSFGPAMANALAVGGADGLLIVSPPRRVPPAAFDELAAYGRVRALVASNAFHYLGLAEWKARFPDAALFAPAQSIARIERKSGLPGIRPLSDAASLTGPGLDLVDMPHYRTGEVLVRVRTARGVVWYVTDILMNMPELPAHPIAKAVFALSRSAPGLRINNVAPLFMVKDKAALKRWLGTEFRKAPPQWLIAAHGDIAHIDSPEQTAQRLFGA